MDNNDQKIIDLKKVFSTLWAKRKKFFWLWIIVFVLSCVWIFPQPRYYTCEVKLAPEAGGADVGGGLASIASSFGFNLGSLAGSDAIYPTLYPELFESTEFITSLYNIQIHTKDNSYQGDYYTYMKHHQKKNILLQPFKKLKNVIKSWFEDDDVVGNSNGSIDPFQMSRKDFELLLTIEDNLKCGNDKKTDVTTVVVTDQDPLVSALLADSISTRLQEFVIRYRTKKARMDAAYYKSLCDSAKAEFDSVSALYCKYVDSHLNVSLKTYSHEAEILETEKEMKQQTYLAFCSQLQAMNAKIQERTPVFTVLKSATVPVKPAGPKRVLFVAGMLILSTIFASIYFCRKMLPEEI